MDKIDLKIYIAQLLNAFESSSDEAESGYDAIRYDFDLDKNEYTDEMIREALINELELEVESNMIDHDTPKLTMEQFESCVLKTSTRLILESMIKKGLIEATFDSEQMENVYSLTEKGQQLTGKIF
jgi:hypothetical protein